MAFTTAQPRGGSPSRDDRLLLYVTGRCLSSSSSGGGRVVGLGRVTRAVQRLEQPFALSGRRFLSDLVFALEGLSDIASGMELKPLVPSLSAFPSAATLVDASTTTTPATSASRRGVDSGASGADVEQARGEGGCIFGSL